MYLLVYKQLLSYLHAYTYMHTDMSIYVCLHEELGVCMCVYMYMHPFLTQPTNMSQKPPWIHKTGVTDFEPRR